jgi:hypothetical protein
VSSAYGYNACAGGVIPGVRVIGSPNAAARGAIRDVERARMAADTARERDRDLARRVLGRQWITDDRQ